MTDRRRDHVRGQGLGPAHRASPAPPLDVLADHHSRIRDLCTLIEYITDRPRTHPEIIAEVSDFVRRELPILISDESDDLLPLMQRRCEPEDEIVRLRTRLDAEHDTALYLLPDALETLDALRDGRADIPEASISLLRTFAAHLHRHLIFENAILIPLARARLTRADLDALRARMEARRGSSQTGGRSDAG